MQFSSIFTFSCGPNYDPKIFRFDTFYNALQSFALISAVYFSRYGYDIMERSDNDKTPWEGYLAAKSGACLLNTSAADDE